MLGFRVAHGRLEDGVTVLERGPVQLMLEAAALGRQTGPLEYPYGRGVPDVGALLARVTGAGHPLFEPLTH